MYFFFFPFRTCIKLHITWGEKHFFKFLRASCLLPLFYFILFFFYFFIFKKGGKTSCTCGRSSLHLDATGISSLINQERKNIYSNEFSDWVAVTERRVRFRCDRLGRRGLKPLDAGWEGKSAANQNAQWGWRPRVSAAEWQPSQHWTQRSSCNIAFSWMSSPNSEGFTWKCVILIWIENSLLRELARGLTLEKCLFFK